ncbi:hypothetical protein MKW92_049695 [Papaver armeniacum]|nr:hypothetical protein MKW92_049695 [Papaver armeniacum]
MGKSFINITFFAALLLIMICSAPHFTAGDLLGGLLSDDSLLGGNPDADTRGQLVGGRKIDGPLGR